MTRKIDWPETAFYHARPEGLDRDVVLLLGIEPNLRWRTFTELLVGLVRELGVEMMITLGALLADVPHPRPSPVTGSASDPDLVRQLGLSESRYEGPTGIVGVLHDACKQAEISSASLWVAVPHYVSLTPSPRAAVALCERLGGLIGLEIEVSELEEAAQSYEEQVGGRSPRTRRPRPVEAEQRMDSQDLRAPSGAGGRGSLPTRAGRTAATKTPPASNGGTSAVSVVRTA
jgi:predicted ATP-grasp superfamily ATP-dependent carboligase